MTRPETAATGIRFGEGPVWCADDGTLVVTSVVDGALYRVWPETGHVELVAATGAAPTGRRSHPTDRCS
jgi:sugar lactone lactonase YvrE